MRLLMMRKNQLLSSRSLLYKLNCSSASIDSLSFMIITEKVKSPALILICKCRRACRDSFCCGRCARIFYRHTLSPEPARDMFQTSLLNSHLYRVCRGFFVLFFLFFWPYYSPFFCSGRIGAKTSSKRALFLAIRAKI